MINRIEEHSEKIIDTNSSFFFKDLKYGQHGTIVCQQVANTNEMDEFLETHKLAKLTPEEMEKSE